MYDVIADYIIFLRDLYGFFHGYTIWQNDETEGISDDESDFVPIVRKRIRCIIVGSNDG